MSNNEATDDLTVILSENAAGKSEMLSNEVLSNPDVLS